MPLSKEGDIIARLQHDKSQTQSYRKSVGILLDVLHEKEGIKFRDYLDAEREICSVRSVETAQAWIALLQAAEMKLPEKLPSAEEIDFERRESNGKQIRVAHFNVYLRLSLIGSCIGALSSLDMAEAKSEIESFLERFEKNTVILREERKCSIRIESKKASKKRESRRGKPRGKPV